MAISRVTVTLPEDVLAEIDRTEANRSRFVLEAVTRELARRREAALRASLKTSHSELMTVAEAGIAEMRKHVLETANPEFPQKVQPGDIIVAGRNFGCSSGRAIAPKALKATLIGGILAEFFSRTFYRNGPEIGLPILEVAGIHAMVETGHRLRVDIEQGKVENLSTGQSIQGTAPSGVLLDMLLAGGLIPLLKSDAGRALLAGQIQK